MFTIEYAENAREFFDSVGLSRFEDFFEYRGGTIINRNRKRDVVAFAAGSGADRKELFMKRFHRPHLKDMFFALRSFGRPCSQAGCEFHNAGILLHNGIPTYRPLCCGEQMTLGFEQRSFFITEKLPGQALSDYVGYNWDRIGRYGKEAVMAAMGRFVRKIHNADISMPDLYVWHLFIETHDEGCRFAVIDLHRMRARVGSENEKIRNLGALDYSMIEPYFDEDLKDVFYDSYFGTEFTGDKGLFREKIRRRARRLKSRRRRPPSYCRT